jgi:RNA polymerase sigma-70 factor (ECF subfamily)
MNPVTSRTVETCAFPTPAPQDAPSSTIRAKDDEARFNRVVLPHLADALVLARRLTRNNSDAQDVVQEASIRALRGIGTFANGDTRAWVLSIVRNTACDWLRKNRPLALVFVDGLEDVEGTRPVEADATTPETALIKIQDERRLETAISTLPAHFRETLLLRDVQGLPYRDIAERTGVSIGTVMSRLFRARRRLVGLLNPNGERGSCGAESHQSRGITAIRRQSPAMTACVEDPDAEWTETLRLTA